MDDVGLGGARTWEFGGGGMGGGEGERQRLKSAFLAIVVMACDWSIIFLFYLIRLVWSVAFSIALV